MNKRWSNHLSISEALRTDLVAWDLAFHDALLQAEEHKRRIQENPTHYFDEAEDKETKEAYYQTLSFEQDGHELYQALHELVKGTHFHQIPYHESTSKHLYPWVDLQENGMLKSIYAGKEQDPEEAIKHDYQVALEKRKMAETYSFNELPPHTITEMEQKLKYNCEHVVPQSWFRKQEPMKGDLHHLFTCEPRCNSMRSNHPYHDFAEYTPERSVAGIRDACGKQEGNFFEPEYGKGIVARATLYFLIRYPEEIQNEFYHQIDRTLLIRWHNEFPVSRYEKHRNQAIYVIQGNRNPFIDFPELTDKIEW
ncbi:endonuclease I family protein [Priestia koreensis]|uniref:endonuclease I family protein n=1 Tax=Priestia koreensis TaxID=284581 RepID=UPI0009FABE33|nr:endonuclease [Priestia koreensis]